jgi:hypothetical protein
MSMTQQLASATKVELRILQEGYGDGAWHGPDLKAAVDDVSPSLAFWRPAPDRHNIAEIVVHHAYFVRSVRAQISQRPPEPFILEGEEWFDIADDRRLSWPDIRKALDTEQQRLREVIAEDASSNDDTRFGLVLGITCHAVYHAGHIQLIKRLHG